MVVTLQPEAVAQGVSYQVALLQAKMALDLPSCGIENISDRETATVARAIEILGLRGPEQMDLLSWNLQTT